MPRKGANNAKKPDMIDYFLEFHIEFWYDDNSGREGSCV